MNRHLRFFILLLFFMSLMAQTTMAKTTFEVPTRKAGTYVYDTEGSIAQKTEQKIEELLKKLAAHSNVKVYIVTFKDLRTDTMEEAIYAERVLKKFEEKEKTVVLLFISQTKKSITVKSSGPEKQINADVWKIVSNYREEIENNFSAVAYDATKKVVETICKSLKIELDGIYPKPESSGYTGGYQIDLLNTGIVIASIAGSAMGTIIIFQLVVERIVESIKEVIIMLKEDDDSEEEE